MTLNEIWLKLSRKPVLPVPGDHVHSLPDDWKEGDYVYDECVKLMKLAYAVDSKCLDVNSRVVDWDKIYHQCQVWAFG